MLDLTVKLFIIDKFVIFTLLVIKLFETKLLTDKFPKTVILFLIFRLLPEYNVPKLDKEASAL